MNTKDNEDDNGEETAMDTKDKEEDNGENTAMELDGKEQVVIVIENEKEQEVIENEYEDTIFINNNEKRIVKENHLLNENGFCRFCKKYKCGKEQQWKT